jgi:transposase
MGRSRGGLTTKIHAVTDARGLPIRFALTPGQVHDGQMAAGLLGPLAQGCIVLADKAYDADWIRDHIEQQGAAPNIPDKTNRKDRHCFSAVLYRERNRIERFFNRVKHCRRIATRFEKHAANYLAMLKLAAIRIWLRANESMA